MITMNLKARLKNKTWWIGIISLIILLSQQCGFDLSTYIPKNYTDIINTLFAFLAAIGITVDTSTSGISDQVVVDATVQAINQENETKEEDSTTSINNLVTENSQSSSSDTGATLIDKESETNSNVDTSSNVQVSTDNTISTTTQDASPIVDVNAVLAQNEILKAQIAQVQSAIATTDRNTITSTAAVQA